MTHRESGAGEPDGYAYRYPDGIRFNGGITINGSAPIEAIPYYFGEPADLPAQGQPEKCKSPLCGEPLCPHGKCRGSYLGCEECDGPIVDMAEQPQMSVRGWPDYLPLHPDAVIAAILNEWIRRFITSPSAEEIKRASRMVQDFAEAFARSRDGGER